MDCGTDEGCRHPCTDPTSHALPPASVGAAPANDDVPDDDDGLLHESVKTRLDELATYLRPAGCRVSSWPVERKLCALVGCGVDLGGAAAAAAPAAALAACHALADRLVTELILQHQVPSQMSAHLWAAVRAHGCQFLGPAMQEEILKLILLALDNGAALSRKVLTLFIVSKLERQYAQASRTAVGHVVQLLYRASCFKLIEREAESSLMQLQPELATYESLCQQHDSQIVQIACDAGLRIGPEQWSSLLYADLTHKSHMQSIIDKLQATRSMYDNIQDLHVAVRRIGDPHNLAELFTPLHLLAEIDPLTAVSRPSWRCLLTALAAVRVVLSSLAALTEGGVTRPPATPPVAQPPRYKTDMCRDVQRTGRCPRGAACTFAHLEEELNRYRARCKRKNGSDVGSPQEQT